MPWLPSERCMLLWGAKMSTGPGREVASSTPDMLLCALVPMGFLSGPG